MKNMFFLIVIAMMIFSPLTMSADTTGLEDTSDLPEYKGDLQGLDYFVVYKSPSLWVVNIGGKLYIYRVVK